MKKITTILLLMVLLVGCTQSQETEPIEAPKQAVQTKEHDPYRIDYDTVSETDTTHDIKVIETTQTFNSQTLNRYMYTDKDNNDYPVGYPIVVKKDTALTLNVENQTQTDTNIHWHGLSLPNDQDGPALLINPQQTFQYQFTPDYQGTYWYHSHNRPVRDQVDFGMYGPLVILEPKMQSIR
ncbi:multicopper oxidase domain-containing protein [Erysipelothrix sp. D19-032]